MNTFGFFKQWQEVSKPMNTIDKNLKEYLTEFFKNLGFKNILVHSNGKVDADKDGKRFIRLHLSGYNSEINEDDNIITQTVNIGYLETK